MQKCFKNIGIIGKYTDPSIADTLSSLCQFLHKNQYKVFMDDHSSKHTLPTDKAVTGCALELLPQHCDLIIAAGGDGTFLSAARACAPFQVPLIGVNLGRLGFLVDISPKMLLTYLEQILSGRYIEEPRYLLRTTIIRDDQIIHEQTAVNEIVIHRWVTPSLIEIITKIDGIFLNSQRSDGLIVATPTGSTAYSLSAGGPILHPRLNALVLVPLNPHTLSNRPIVIDDSAEIEISFAQSKQINAQVTCDHLQIPDVLVSDKILVKKDPKPIKILHPEGHEFFDTLRQKLNWSNENQI